jgi:hypothetical protein
VAALIGIRREYDRTFVLDEAKLRRIVDVFESHAAKLGFETFMYYHLGRSDDSFHDTEDIDEVLADDNSGHRSIDHLIVELHRISDKPLGPPGSDHRPRPLAYVGYFRDGRKTVSQAVIQDKRDWCVLVSDEIDVQIKRTLNSGRLKYLKSRAFDFTTVLIILGVSAILISIFLLSATATYSSADIARMSLEERTSRMMEILVARDRSQGIALSIFAVVLLVTAVLTQFTPLSRLAKWWDRSVFYWGDMASDYDKFTAMMTRIKWGLVIAFGVSVLASLFVAGVVKIT